MKLSAMFGALGVVIAIIAILAVRYDSMWVLAVPVLLIAGIVGSWWSGRKRYGTSSLKGLAIPMLPFALGTAAATFILKPVLGG